MNSRPPRLADLVEILRNAGLVLEVHGPEDVLLPGVAQDSRAVRPGDIFLAWKGVDADAHDHLPQAVEAGAVAAVVERLVPGLEIPMVVVSDGRLAAAIAADLVHDSPWKKLFTCAVTGTNGKTTTTLIARHLLEGRGPAAAIGTLGVTGIDGTVRPGTEGLTTPGPVALAEWLRKLEEEGVRSVSLEASSHALEQRRLDGARFDVAVFTNFGRDHIDYHVTEEAYFESKARLLDLVAPTGMAVVNADDPAWRRLLDEKSAKLAGRVLTFGTKADADLRAANVELLPDGARFDLRHEGEMHTVRLPLLGDFNVENALAAAGVGRVAGMSLAEIASGLESSPQVPGRLEIIAREPFTVVVDFAHTAEALRHVLSTLRPLVRGRLITLFGAGGDRDREKRPLMGRAVAELADLAIVTSDNPRHEDPEQILDDIVRGMPEGGYERIVDRKRAIARALEVATLGDFVLLAGKGHERFQSIGGKKLPFDERLIVDELLGRAA